MEDQTTNIVQFPLVNRRHDVSNIALDPEEVADKIRLMKLSYFNSVTEELVDDVLRSLSTLRLEETPAETTPVTSLDIIMLKETIMAMLCRIVGISHPLHEMAQDNIILSELMDDNEYGIPYQKYHFKSDPDFTLDQDTGAGEL